MDQGNMAQSNTHVDFYPRKIYHCRRLRTFLGKEYNEECFSSINEVFYALKKNKPLSANSSCLQC